MKRIRNQLTYANVISTMALFLVLGGGTALAAFVVTSNADIGRTRSRATVRRRALTRT